MTFRISNRDARRLWLSNQALAATPTGPADPLTTIRQLGFVQLDSIQVLARAHHHILWSRNQNYREPMLDKLLAKDRSVFEHFTHDASVLPIETYPYWRRQFRRKAEIMSQAGWFKGLPGPQDRQAIKARIANEGALSTMAFDTKIQGAKEMWKRPPHKLALDFMWYTGELSTCYRENFRKFYNLSERVIPDAMRDTDIDEGVALDWLCRQAVDRLGFASPGEIQRFWDTASAVEIRAWVDGADLRPVQVETAAREWITMLAPPDISDRLENASAATSRLRILSPFDPVVRDRDRMKRLFGFDYRIEIFVPAAKRKWGYYVYPLLEGDRFVGRIEAKADRKAGVLTVYKLWAEQGVRWTPARATKLDAELIRMARFVGTPNIAWDCAPHPES
ncbi:crosslink repair DNA glycosylase YcaQ family protein [Shimia sp.]|uniref:winged helix-turn-helix domain-containing protein n=1 Tax=Shimia sp. TaxID=1954381 RepID=UPI00329A1F7F